MTLYDVLGVTPDASPEEIKRAYRKAAKASHPDSGGSVEQFENVQKAYEVLSDPIRRRRYDDGDEDDASSLGFERRMAQTVVTRIFTQFISGDANLENTDLVELARQRLRQERERHELQCRRLAQRADRIAIICSRIEHNGGSTDQIGEALAACRDGIEAELNKARQQIRIMDEATIILANYTYRTNLTSESETLWS